MSRKIENLIVDTTAFIKNAPLHEIAENIITIQEVVDEVINKRQIRRLVVLPYDLKILNVDPEYIKIVTDFSKKTGDYVSLSATDIKVIALTYQLEKEHVGTSHLRDKPIIPVVHVAKNSTKKDDTVNDKTFNIPSLVNENEEDSGEGESSDETCPFEDEYDIKSTVDLENEKGEVTSVNQDVLNEENETCSSEEESESDDEGNWITPNNIQAIKKASDDLLEKSETVKVACITTDFAMQNVLKQIGLNVSALDGRMIKQLRTFILRCYTCFKTTSLMEKVFCPKCGNKTLKKVSASLDENGQLKIHINMRKPVTTRGKKFSLPTFKGGKHSNNPILAEDQPMPQQRISKKAKMKNNPLDPDYIASYSPFVMRDVNSRAAYLGIRSGSEIKHWMKKNPNEVRRRKK